MAYGDPHCKLTWHGKWLYSQGQDAPSKAEVTADIDIALDFGAAVVDDSSHIFVVVYAVPRVAADTDHVEVVHLDCNDLFRSALLVNSCHDTSASPARSLPLLRLCFTQYKGDTAH